MTDLLINLKDIPEEKINHTEKGNSFIALRMRKIRKPKSAATHVLFLKNKNNILYFISNTSPDKPKEVGDGSQ